MRAGGLRVRVLAHQAHRRGGGRDVPGRSQPGGNERRDSGGAVGVAGAGFEKHLVRSTQVSAGRSSQLVARRSQLPS